MISAKDPREHYKQKQDDHEEHPKCLHMILHALIGNRFPSLRVSVTCDSKKYHLNPGLEEKEEPELSVVKFSNTATDPEAVMVELAHTLTAVMAVAATIRLLNVTHVAEALGWHFHWFGMAHARYRLLDHPCLFIRGINFSDLTHLDHVFEVRTKRKTYRYVVKTRKILMRLLVCVHRAQVLGLFNILFDSFAALNKPWVLAGRQEVPRCRDLQDCNIYEPHEIAGRA